MNKIGTGGAAVSAGPGFYFRKYVIALIIMIICAISLVHGYAVRLEKLDMQIFCAEEFYNRLLPYSYIRSVVSSPLDKLERACEDIIVFLGKNGVHESRYCASIFTKEAVKAFSADPARSEALLNCAKKLSPGYQKAYFSQAVLSAYNFDVHGALSNAADIFYFNFLAPASIFDSMNLALIFLLSAVAIQFIFLASQYVRYRRLIMHEAHEFGVSMAAVPLARYLSPRERAVSSVLNKSAAACLVFIIIYCYFSTGFGKYLRLSVEANDFLKNPHEYFAINAMPVRPGGASDLDSVLAPAFKDEKLSIDFYYYFSYLAKSTSGDSHGAMRYLKKIGASSPLAAKISGPAGPRSFLDDADLYCAFFSPIRSNPVFMIAVLLNVLLIIVFMGIIRKVSIVRDGARADICACSTISCPECRVQVGLCNSCLMPLKQQDQGRNIGGIFYPHDQDVIFYASFALPGFSFFYFSEHGLAFFYSGLILNLTVYNAAYLSGLILEGAGHIPLLALVYSIYAVENYFFTRGRTV